MKYNNTAARVGAFVTTMMISGNAFATDANATMATVTDRTSNMVNFMMIGSYVIGVAFAISGLLKIKDSVENPGNAPIKDGLMRLLIGGGLLALGTIIDTMFGTVDQGTNYEIQELDAFDSGNLTGR